jgi:hypothetical protein
MRGLVGVVLLVCVGGAMAWPYGLQQVRGVNIGSWLLLEKWITPSVFSGLPDSVNDEFQLCESLGKDAAEQRLRSHWYVLYDFGLSVCPSELTN